MNKRDVVKAVAERADVSNACALRVVDSFFAVLKDALAEEVSVNFVGFGQFTTKTLKERRGSHPQTAKPYIIKAKRIPVFRAGTDFLGKVALKEDV